MHSYLTRVLHVRMHGYSHLVESTVNGGRIVVMHINVFFCYGALTLHYNYVFIIVGETTSEQYFRHRRAHSIIDFPNANSITSSLVI